MSNLQSYVIDGSDSKHVPSQQKSIDPKLHSSSPSKHSAVGQFSALSTHVNGVSLPGISLQHIGGLIPIPHIGLGLAATQVLGEAIPGWQL